MKHKHKHKHKCKLMQGYTPYILGVVLLIGLGYFLMSGGANSRMVALRNSDDNITKIQRELETVSIQSESGDKEKKNGDDGVRQDKSGGLLNYENVDLNNLSGKVVLDFSATWCPSCQAIKKDMEKKVSMIPSGINIVIVDYDSNKDLRKKYGVTGQHTFVQIDGEQNKIKLWRGGSRLEDVLENII